MIKITSKQEGFRRAGVAHSVAPREYPDEAFTNKQLGQLQAEPMLTVMIVEEKAKSVKVENKTAGKTEGTK